MNEVLVEQVEQTDLIANRLAQQLCDQHIDGLNIHLIGDLGAGKTSFARAFIQTLGHDGAVRSPTYNIVQNYSPGKTIYHFDLYRLSDPEELEALGIRDYFSEDAICLIEWPENGADILPTPDLTLTITFDQKNRCLAFTAGSEKGHKILSNMDYTFPG